MAFLHPAPFLQVPDVEVNVQDPTAMRVTISLGGGREKSLTPAQLYQEVLTAPATTLAVLKAVQQWRVRGRCRTSRGGCRSAPAGPEGLQAAPPRTSAEPPARTCPPEVPSG